MQKVERFQMRIVAGTYKSRKILAPNSSLVRPTKDRIREAVFSILGDISNKTFLDLYAGSGAFGIEALSRGASHIYFVDNFLNSINCIKDNLKSLNIVDNFDIYYKNDTESLNTFKEEGKRFDIIFLDPPYQKGKYQEIISYIIDNDLLNKNGIIICESNYEINVDDSLFSKHKTYKYGEILINIYWR